MDKIEGIRDSARKANILIVEDEPLEAEHLKLHLQQTGHRVVGSVTTGEEAIERVEQGDVDFMVVDIVLAGEIDGIETVRLIHKKHDIPTIFITAYASEDLLMRAEQVRPFAYLLKPYRQREMEFLISMSFARVQVENELLEQKQIAEAKRLLVQKELLEQEQRLKHSQKMDALGNLTGGVAHDYNNMLGVILGYAELLKDNLGDQPRLAKYADEIVQAGERGAKLTNKLLSFSRQKIADADMLDLNEILLSHQDMLQKTLTARIKLELDLTDNLWSVFIDSGDLVDGIINLSINAMHAIDGKGKLTLQTRKKHIHAAEAETLKLTAGDYVQLNIMDTGRGMNEATRQQIFDPFFSTKGEKGTGLGLSQVYGLIERSRGAIKVQSELSHGTRFELYFPRYYDVCIAEESSETNKSEDSVNGEKILIVDDEPALLGLVSELLERQGYTTICAENGQRALQILENQSIDLMLSDIIMPDMDGYELAAAVRKKYPRLKIQLASGFSDTSHKEMVDAELNSKLLQKPYNSSVLLKNIRQLLDE